MGTIEVFPFFLFFFPLSFISASTEICSNSVCRRNEPVIRFPFRLKDRQPKDCGYPGFDLTCDNRNETVLKLPSSGEFSVRGMDYATQKIWINDPGNCLLRRLLNFSLSGSPFKGVYYQNFTFLNCSSEFQGSRLKRITCLSSSTYTVWATSSMTLARMASSSCKIISTVSVPIQWAYYEPGLSSDLSEDLYLTWGAPNCGKCEAQGGRCGFKSNNTRETGCSDLPRRGLPRSARYAIIIGVGIPALMCIIGLACYICGRIKAYGRPHHPVPESSSSISPQTIIVVGLDGATIESFPKLVLGESRRVPKPNDSTCPICLSEYKPKDTLRSIPECKHCFHVDCIDEWLPKNATCPVCRNFPLSPPPC
ncbi:hypothetical protein HHK36_000078 [Tetracentron sinense]|uniref:RING-type E3 ubiquitin transferase n=1 Tax=Tetracentron sinense TaxID=13715 RepID=A0A834ZTH2_TETSI|nr:hypothetical protein HHK36_000078 [Tetracentron sinense]